MEAYLSSHGHIHVYLDDGTKVEASKGNTSFYDDHFKVEDGAGVANVFPYGHIVRVEVPFDPID